MGLDMYLYRVPKVESIEELEIMNEKLDDSFIANNLMNCLNDIQKEKKYIYNIDFNINSFVDIDKFKADREGWGNLINLRIGVAYWRKFNALHKWIVDHIQGGNDNCGDYLVSTEKLEDLLNVLNSLNKDNANILFPTQSGFFFGHTDFDEYYWGQVEELKSTLSFLINQQPHGSSYLYTSSW